MVLVANFYVNLSQRVRLQNVGCLKEPVAARKIAVEPADKAAERRKCNRACIVSAHRQILGMAPVVCV